MNEFKVAGMQVVVAATVAAALTWVSGWGFVDSTQVARWVQATSIASELVNAAGNAAGSEAGGERRVALIQ